MDRRIKIITGWMGKTVNLKDIIRYTFYCDSTIPHLELDSGYIFKTKNKKDDWDEEDWPPKKIKITIELEDKR